MLFSKQEVVKPLRDRSLILEGGSVGDKHQILNFFRAAAIDRPLFSRRPHLHLENLGPPLNLVPRAILPPRYRRRRYRGGKMALGTRLPSSNI